MRRKHNQIGGPHGGVYVLYAAHDSKIIWVGESTDCRRRNRQAGLLGLRWECVCSMVGSTKAERLAMELQVTAEWEVRGYKNVALHNRGREHSAETREKVSRALKGVVRSAAWRKKISAATQGRTPWNKGTGKPKPPARARGEAARGRPRPQSVRDKIGAAHRGMKKHTRASKAKLRAANLGRKPSAASRAKMSASQLVRWSRVRR